MEIELRHMRSFLTVAQEMHFGRAAERLHIAQPVLSRQVRGLEQELGTALFDRSSRPIRLTNAGTAFLEEAQLAVHQAGRAVETGRRAARGEVGHLSVEATFWAYNAIVPSAVRAYRSRSPDVSIALSTAIGPTALIDGLQKERLDVCFAAFAQWLVGRRALEVEPLLEEQMVAIVAEGHRFAQLPEVTLDELAEEPLVALSHAVVPGLIDRQMAVFHERGLSPTQVQEVPDPMALFCLVGAGVGVGIHMASFSNLRHPGVSFVPIAGDAPTAKLLLLWRRGDDRDIVRGFIDTARQVARSLEPPDVFRATRQRPPAPFTDEEGEDVASASSEPDP